MNPRIFGELGEAKMRKIKAAALALTMSCTPSICDASNHSVISTENYRLGTT